MLKHNSIKKDEYSKALFAHMQKAINSQEFPPKAKHVRAIILETHHQKSSTFMYSAISGLQILTNQIACWKYLIVLHKILRNGYNEAIRYAPQKIALFEEIKRTWVAFPGCYSQIICQLCCVLAKKFNFHRNYPNIPGDLEISQKTIMSSIGRKTENLLAFSLALLDYLEILLSFQLSVMATIVHSDNSSVSSNNCRLSALIQCVQDCAALYDLALKTLIRLHALLPSETLTSSRARFNNLYLILERFFVRANNYACIHDVLKIPLLPSVPPNLLSSTAGSQSIEVTETPDAEEKEEKIGQLIILEKSIDGNDESKSEDVDAIFGKFADSRLSISEPNSQYGNLLEIETFKSDNQLKQGQLFVRIGILESEIKTLLQVKSRQDEQLTLLIDEVKNRTSEAAASEEKFVKVCDAYGKLREEYISILKQVETPLTNGFDTNQRVRELENMTLAYEEVQRTLESQLVDARSALLMAENKSNNLRKAAQLELCDSMVRNTCCKAKVEAKSMVPLMQDPEFFQCRSCAEVIISYAQWTTAEVIHLKDLISDVDGNDITTLPLVITRISIYQNATLFHAKAVANAATDVLKSDELSALCTRCSVEGFEIYSHLYSNGITACSKPVVLNHVEELLGSLSRIKELADQLRPIIKDVSEEDLVMVLEQEMERTEEIISQAKARFGELLQQSKTSMTGIKLEVHSNILNNCTELMSCVLQLIARARHLQIEIVNEGRGTTTVKEFYKRHNRWTEGLFSAAKSVGVGANLLVEIADTIVTTNSGKFERLMVAALEISSLTTQVLVASRVKAREDSYYLRQVETAARSVSRVTGEVVANVQNASTIDEQAQNMDFAGLTYTQARKNEVDTQVRVLELEAQLVEERKRLAQIRRFNYSNASDFEQKSQIQRT